MKNNCVSVQTPSLTSILPSNPIVPVLWSFLRSCHDVNLLVTGVVLRRLSETCQTGKYSDLDGNVHVSRSVGLARSQEPLGSEDLTVTFTYCHFSLRFRKPEPSGAIRAQVPI